jgi:hypothetical protein
MLFLVALYQMELANTILNTGVGPALILLGLLLSGIAAARVLKANSSGIDLLFLAGKLRIGWFFINTAT